MGWVFGTWNAPITDGDQPIGAPIGMLCAHCNEQICDGDNGRIQQDGIAVHRECHLRAVLGGIGHQVDHALFCGPGGLGPDAGLGRRASSLLVWELWGELAGRPFSSLPEEERRRWHERILDLAAEAEMPRQLGETR